MARERSAATAGRRADAPLWLQRPGDRLAKGLSAVGLERWARLAAALLSVFLLILDGRFADHLLLVVALNVYVVATGLARRDRYLRSADLVAAALLAVFSGTDTGAFVPFLVVAVAGTAAQAGLLTGLLTGATMSMVVALAAVVTGPPGTWQDDGVVAVVLLLPMVGVLTASAAQLLSDRTVRDRLAMQEANRLLASLSDIADDLPGGLDLDTVTAAIIAEVRDLPGAAAALLLLRAGDELRVVGSTGRSPPPGLRLRYAEVEQLLTRRRPLRPDRGELTERLRRLLGEDAAAWHALALGGDEQATGALFAGFHSVEAARAARTRLRTVAADGGLALDNARLFGGTQLRAADAARRHIASELHDGVAQSLAHLQLELGLLARSDRTDPAELARLARVAETALGDLRGTIAGLRAPAASDVGALLSRHLDDLRSRHGPLLTLTIDDRVLLAPERADEVFRVAQEAVSNALRHARADHIELTLGSRDGVAILQVRDDGDGLPTAPDAHPAEQPGTDPAQAPGTDPSQAPGTDPERGGVGFVSMRDRAARLGGDLEVAPAAGGGTVVTLTLPVEPILPPGSR